MTQTIACADCGHPVHTTRRNTRYDSVCRLIRDLPFVAGQVRSCALCGQKYAPLDVRDNVCGDCAPPLDKNGTTSCAFCGQERPRVRAEIAVCNGCARDPELRRKFWSSLKRKQQERKEAVDVRQAPA